MHALRAIRTGQPIAQVVTCKRGEVVGQDPYTSYSHQICLVRATWQQWGSGAHLAMAMHTWPKDRTFAQLWPVRQVCMRAVSGCGAAPPGRSQAY